MDLVIMAAGFGTRYGNKIKQLESVGPSGELIIDYSIFDAIKAGFDRIVFVIRRDIEKEFRAKIGDRISKQINVAYAYQSVKDIPAQYKEKFMYRIKSWGTGQAVLACKDIIHGPFAVINADDYYGQDAFVKMQKFLSKRNPQNSICMVGFSLKNTLSQNGAVTRGICNIKRNKLVGITETKGIRAFGNAIITENGQRLPEDSICSMNMWGLNSFIFDVLEERFLDFLENTSPDDLTAEFLLPCIIGDLLKEKAVSVDVLRTTSKWFGVTYSEDKPFVVKSIANLVKCGLYPRKNIGYIEK